MSCNFDAKRLNKKITKTLGFISSAKVMARQPQAKTNYYSTSDTVFLYFNFYQCFSNFEFARRSVRFNSKL